MDSGLVSDAVPSLRALLTLKAIHTDFAHILIAMDLFIARVNLQDAQVHSLDNFILRMEYIRDTLKTTNSMGLVRYMMQAEFYRAKEGLRKAT